MLPQNIQVYSFYYNILGATPTGSVINLYNWIDAVFLMSRGCTREKLHYDEVTGRRIW